MRCAELSELIHGYLDGELDLVRSLEVEEHLKDCPGCMQGYHEHQALHTALSSGHLYFEAPARLRKSVNAVVRAASRAEAPRSIWWMPRLRLFVPVALAALAALLALVFLTPAARNNPLAQQIVSAQVDSLQKDHLTEVASADPSILKSWFYAKLGFGVPAVDLASHDFPLLGGRSTTIAQHPAAVLVYYYQKQPVSLFVWPLKGEPTSPEKHLRHRGYQLVHWTQSGLSCWAVSDIKPAALQQFAKLVQEKGYPSGNAPKGEGTGTAPW